MTGDKDMFRELAENDGPRKYVTFGDNSKGKVVGLGKVAISHDIFKNRGGSAQPHGRLSPVVAPH